MRWAIVVALVVIIALLILILVVLVPPAEDKNARCREVWRVIEDPATDWDDWYDNRDYFLDNCKLELDEPVAK